MRGGSYGCCYGFKTEINLNSIRLDVVQHVVPSKYSLNILIIITDCCDFFFCGLKKEKVDL